MAASDRSGFDRRESLRAPVRLSMQQQNEDLSDDEYDLQAMGVSDGFRPTGTTNQMPTRTSNHDPLNRRSTPPPRPSSMTKPRFDNLALRHDGNSAASPMGLMGIASGSNIGSVTRSSSISTDAPMMRPESPYRGPSAPSHPYQMYPQDARLARTASVATTSTFQPSGERQYAGPSGPTHPYGMYPQNTVPESDQDEITPVNIPVGFPGRPNEYHRRLGPEGEEAADIIGPDGHTEQLPPYSQYPDEAFARKTRGAGPMVAAEGAGGIGLATRNPEFASAEDLSLPQSRLSTRSNTSDTEHQQINAAAYGASEKAPEKKWKSVARRKVWGIVPVWVLVLAGLIILLFALITGVAMGVMKSKMKDPPKPSKDQSSSSSSSSTTMTTMYDATPLASVPTGLPSLAVGTYGLPIGTPNTAGQTCLSSSTQYNTWSCNLPFVQISVVISPVSGGGMLNSYKMAIRSDITLTQLLYGTQPPSVTTDQILSLVNDTNVKQYGPAWFFQLAYDKVVIVAENAFTAPTSKAKRGSQPGKYDQEPDDFTRRRGVAGPGDKPWFCYWNNTLLEAFVYANASSAAGAASGSAITTTSSPSLPTTSSTTKSTASSTVSGSSPSSSANSAGPFLPVYPKIIRLEERRMPSTPNTISPYCQKMQILDDGRAVPWPDSNGQPLIVTLNETDPNNLKLRSEVDLFERDSNDGCNCVWIST